MQYCEINDLSLDLNASTLLTKSKLLNIFGQIKFVEIAFFAISDNALFRPDSQSVNKIRNVVFLDVHACICNAFTVQYDTATTN